MLFAVHHDENVVVVGYLCFLSSGEKVIASCFHSILRDLILGLDCLRKDSVVCVAFLNSCILGRKQAPGGQSDLIALRNRANLASALTRRAEHHPKRRR